MKVLCVDPGVTTGWALFNDCKLDLVASGQTRIPYDLFTKDKEPDIIVYERYFISMPHQETIPAEVIGMLKLYTKQKGIILVRQEPTILTFVDSRFLKGRRINRPGVHERDAIRHGIQFLYTQVGSDVTRLIDRITKGA